MLKIDLPFAITIYRHFQVDLEAIEVEEELEEVVLEAASEVVEEVVVLQEVAEEEQEEEQRPLSLVFSSSTA